MQEFSVKQSNLDFRTREAYKMLRTNIEFSGDNNKVIFNHLDDNKNNFPT